MSIRHLRARLTSFSKRYPISSEIHAKFSDTKLEFKKLENPVFGSTLLAHCIQSEIPRIIGLIRQSVACSASGDRMERKFPTPFVIKFERVYLAEKIHTATCLKAMEIESCMEYRRGIRQFSFSSLAFDRDEFFQYENVIGQGLLTRPITCKEIPSVVHLKTIIRLEKDTRRFHLDDAVGVAKYFYNLGSMVNKEKITQKEYSEQIEGHPYGVSNATATACWREIPTWLKSYHRPKRIKF